MSIGINDVWAFGGQREEVCLVCACDHLCVAAADVVLQLNFIKIIQVNVNKNGRAGKTGISQSAPNCCLGLVRMCHCSVVHMVSDRRSNTHICAHWLDLRCLVCDNTSRLMLSLKKLVICFDAVYQGKLCCCRSETELHPRILSLNCDVTSVLL